MAHKTVSWQAQRRRQAWGRVFLRGIALLVFLLPLVWSLLASFGIRPNNLVSPPTWTWPPSLANYAEIGVADPGFIGKLLTSFSLSALDTLLTVVIAYLAAYGLVRSRFKGRGILVQGFLVLASLPVIAYVIPLTDTMRYLRLHSTTVGVTLAQAAVYAPLAVYVLFGYLVQISPELEEAAYLDGATALRALWSVVLPVTMPGIAATAIIIFVLNWNLFLVPLLLGGPSLKTVPVAMSDFFTFERELEWSTAAAAVIISLLPLAVFTAMAHRLLEQFNLGLISHEP
ncbi:MAG: carbohydrate ABC transporter permease [Chloroflexi bacterium]|nr:carbohydrate ABC transporter permease [Chloroflexota bacterium]